MARADWAGYLAGFHAQRPGITEDLLATARDGGVDPYQWAAQAVGSGQRVLDLACGSAPLRRHLPGAWVGLDAAGAELDKARTRGRGPLVRGDAAALPFPPGSFDAVVCCMALMLIQPLAEGLAEVARVLRPGGVLVALLPGSRPLSPGDALRYGWLMARLRRRMTYPNGAQLAHPGPVLTAAGMVALDDRRRRFVLPLATPEAADLLVRSLYLPGQPQERVDAAADLARRWVGAPLGVPLRRLVARLGSVPDDDGPAAERAPGWRPA